MIFLLQREVDQFVDTSRHQFFMLQGGFEDFQHRFPFGRRRRQSREGDLAVAIVDEIVKFHGVPQLLLCLQMHPVGGAGEVQCIKTGGHGEIDV